MSSIISLLELPVDIIVHILTFLPATEVFRLERLNREIRNICRQDFLLVQLCLAVAPLRSTRTGAEAREVILAHHTLLSTVDSILWGCVHDGDAENWVRTITRTQQLALHPPTAQVGVSYFSVRFDRTGLPESEFQFGIALDDRSFCLLGSSGDLWNALGRQKQHHATGCPLPDCCEITAKLDRSAGVLAFFVDGVKYPRSVMHDALLDTGLPFVPQVRWLNRHLHPTRYAPDECGVRVQLGRWR
eukprot:TRINITY_DN6614_c0_g2_i1.p1 TRINITY_DN6614_c0_g2~~TRINITY_DN6614_c0_g2_i1.p1  ORF type:complete len:245 (-),score=20.25 TRINITY_DN6614_c0_g2_i1:79-813(-)